MTGTDERWIEDDWATLEALLSDGRSLDLWAREHGALERSRKIRDGRSLLRLALAYGACGKSLRQCCLWAANQGLADLSNEALLKRLRGMGDWLQDIAMARLNAAVGAAVGASGSPGGRRLRLVDGSVISAPGGAPRWRLIATFDVASQRAVGLHLAPSREGEHVDAASVSPDDVIIADRGFARPVDLDRVLHGQAHFLVRLGSRSLRLLDDAGRALACEDLIAAAQAGGGLDRRVQIGHSRRKDWRAIPARLIILPLPAAKARANQARLDRAGQREGYTPSATAYAAASWMLLLTSLPAEAAAPAAIGALYRLRWQIELFFKRLKSLAHLDRLPAKAPDLARTWLYANLIVALVAEHLISQMLDSPPSGPAPSAA